MRATEGRQERRLYRLTIYALLLAGAAPILLPFYWMVVASLKTKERVESYPPDWLPVVPRSFVRIGEQELQVKIFDDGQQSGTGVARVKVLHEKTELPRIRAGQITVEPGDEYYANTGGIRRRVALLPRATGGVEDEDDEIEVALLGALREAVVPLSDLQTRIETHTYWRVLGVELEVRADVGPLPATGQVRLRWDDCPPIAVAPAVCDESVGVAHSGSRNVPAALVSRDTGGGFWTVRLVSPPDGVAVPADELRESTKTRTFAVLNGQPREVKQLAQDLAAGTARVEILDEPQTIRVPRGELERIERNVCRVEILGQTLVIEPTRSPLPSDPNAEVRYRIPGPIAIAADRVRTERPVEPQWRNFGLAWREQTFDRYVVNTLFIAALVVLGTVLSCGLVGYAFARLEFRGRDVLFLILLATMMIPGQVTSIPTFVMFVKFGWLDTYRPLIVPAFLASSAFFIFLYRQFMITIPTDLEDSARIDGCGPLQTWWLIIMPLSKPIIVTVAVFTFIGVWNDFLGPLLYINSDARQTVALGLQNFKSAFQYDDPQVLMAASVMMMVPSIVLFFLAQRAFIRGVVVSGVKG